MVAAKSNFSEHYLLQLSDDPFIPTCPCKIDPTIQVTEIEVCFSSHAPVLPQPMKAKAQGNPSHQLWVLSGHDDHADHEQRDVGNARSSEFDRVKADITIA